MNQGQLTVKIICAVLKETRGISFVLGKDNIDEMNVTKDEKNKMTKLVHQGFQDGTIPTGLTSEPYARAVVADRLMKDKGLHAGQVYAPETKRGPIKSAEQKAVEYKIAQLEASGDDEDKLEQAKAYLVTISKPKTVKPTIDLSALPDFLK